MTEWFWKAPFETTVKNPRPEDQSWCRCDKEYQPLPKPPSQNRVFGWNFASRRLVRSDRRPRLTCFLHSSLTLPPSSGWNQAHLASAGSSKWSGLGKNDQKWPAFIVKVSNVCQPSGDGTETKEQKQVYRSKEIVKKSVCVCVSVGVCIYI